MAQKDAITPQKVLRMGTDEWRTRLFEFGEKPPAQNQEVKEVPPMDIVGFVERPDVQYRLGLGREDVQLTAALVGLNDRDLRAVLQRNGSAGASIAYARRFRQNLFRNLEEKSGLSLSGDRRRFTEEYDSSRMDETERAVLKGDFTVQGWRDTVHNWEHLLAGSYIATDGRTKLTRHGFPLDATANVSFIRVKPDFPEFWNLQASPFPASSSDGITLPLVGAIVGAEGPMSSGRLSFCNIERLTTTNGEPMKYILPQYSNRSLMQVCNPTLVIPMVDGKPILQNRPDSMKDLFNALGGGGLVEFLENSVEAMLPGSYQADKTRGIIGSISLEEYKTAHRDNYRTYLGNHILEMALHPEKCPPGIDPDFFKMFNDLDIKNRLTYWMPNCCAIQYKGTGTLCYDGCHISKEEFEHDQSTDKNLEFQEVVKGDYYVVDKRYKGLAGIILPVAHQHETQVPVGGCSVLEALAYKREQAILERGGKLSGITVGVVKLLDKEKVPEMCTKEICVVLVAIMDDTRRLDMFYGDRLPKEEYYNLYLDFLVDKYGGEPSLGGFTKDWVLSHAGELRDRHLDELMPNLGVTMKAVLDSDLTNPQDQDLVGNISVAGGITDTSDLVRMDDPNHSISYIQHLLEGLELFGRNSGLRSGGIFKTRQFKSLLHGFLGNDSAAIKTYADSITEGKTFENGVQLQKLIGLMTDAYVKQRGGQPTGGYHLSDRELIELLAKDGPLRQKVQLPDRVLSLLRLGHHITVERTVKGELTEVDALELSRAYLEDRLVRVPTRQENARMKHQEYYGVSA